MKAAWYERQGPPSEVLTLGDMATPAPGPGEVLISVAASGVNPGDVKKRQDTFGVGMSFPRVIPHSDGAGTIAEVGDQVPSSRVGERVWCFGAQSYRPFGTAAESVVVPAEQAIALPDGISFEQGACLGIPGITAQRAVHVAGPVDGQVVLVQGGAGAVGQCAIGLARHAGALVITSVRSERDVATSQKAGAHHVVVTGGLSADDIVEGIFAHAPDGIDHIVEVAFHSNISVDERLLTQGGSIATYATGDPTPAIPFWPLVFKNIRLFFLGSDDFPAAAKVAAARALNKALMGEWPGFEVGGRFPLESIAKAHEMVEERTASGRVVVTLEAQERTSQEGRKAKKGAVPSGAVERTRGYTVSLERDIQLTLEGWKRAIANRDDVRLREAPRPARNPATGEVVTLGSPDGDAEVRVDGKWLPLLRWHRTGRVSLDAPPGFEDPENPVRKLAVELARELGARLVGEDGEEY